MCIRDRTGSALLENNFVAYSGIVVIVDAKSITLSLPVSKGSYRVDFSSDSTKNDSALTFALGPNTVFCIGGVLTKSFVKFKGVKYATVMVKEGSKNALKIFDEQLRYEIYPTSGWERMPFKCDDINPSIKK